MKSIKIYVNNQHKPIMEWISDGGDIMFHEIATRILMIKEFTSISDMSKIRVVIQ